MSRNLAALGCVIALSSCTSNAKQQATPTPPPQASPVAALPSPTPSPVADLPVSQVNFSCRLPVVVTVAGQSGQFVDHWSGGFIKFPAATYLPDPAGVLMPVGDGDIATQTAPRLTGHAGGAPFYDLAQKRWLPVGPGLTSPDGSSYAYVAPDLPATDYLVQIFTVATGAHRWWKIGLPPSGTGVGWQAGDYDGRFVYIVAQQVDQFPEGVWRFDLNTGALQQQLSTSSGHVLLVQNGVAWLGLVNPADPAPPNSGKGEAFDTIASIDLATGSQTTWIYRPTEMVIFWGLDSSAHPVVMVRPEPDPGGDLPVVLVDAPGSNGVAIPAFFVFQREMEADVGRLWFGGPHGIYYWTPATGFLKVYDWGPNSAGSQETIVPAGHCV